MATNSKCKCAEAFVQFRPHVRRKINQNITSLCNFCRLFCIITIWQRSASKCSNIGTTSRRLTYAIIRGNALAKTSGWSTNWFQWSKKNSKIIHPCMKTSSKSCAKQCVPRCALYRIAFKLFCNLDVAHRMRCSPNHCWNCHWKVYTCDAKMCMAIVPNVMGPFWLESSLVKMIGKPCIFSGMESPSRVHVLLKWSFSSFSGLMIGIPVTLAAIFIYRRGCFGILGYRPSPADYGRAFYKRTELQEDLHIWNSIDEPKWWRKGKPNLHHTHTHTQNVQSITLIAFIPKRNARIQQRWWWKWSPHIQPRRIILNIWLKIDSNRIENDSCVKKKTRNK